MEDFMAFDFDTPLTLRGAHVDKYDSIARVYGVDAPDTIPMWVADMDFAAAPAVRAVLQAEIDRGYFGYFTNTDPVNRVVADWYRTQHGWDLDHKGVRYTHGVISGLADAFATFSAPGDGVIVFAPVYHAFGRQIRAMGREIVESLLVLRDGQYHMDLETLGASLKGHEKIVILCSPHNPGGRIWSVEEIRAVADFCKTHGLILISDEIHMDLVFPGATFVPTAVAAPESIERLIVVTGASKGFNLAGGETGIAIIQDTTLRVAMDKTILDRESTPNRFAMLMIKAAFTDGAKWSEEVRAYLAENFRIWRDRIDALPGISVMDMQATYLSWVDFTGMGMSDAELKNRIVHQAHVIPSLGPQFGTGGAGHMRFNLALPRATMIEAIERIEAVFSDLQ